MNGTVSHQEPIPPYHLQLQRSPQTNIDSVFISLKIRCTGAVGGDVVESVAREMMREVEEQLVTKSTTNCLWEQTKKPP